MPLSPVNRRRPLDLAAARARQGDGRFSAANLLALTDDLFAEVERQRREVDALRELYREENNARAAKEAELGDVMRRAASDRDEAIAAYASADNELQRQYLQGVAGALDGVLRDCSEGPQQGHKEGQK